MSFKPSVVISLRTGAIKVECFRRTKERSEDIAVNKALIKTNNLNCPLYNINGVALHDFSHKVLCKIEEIIFKI